MDKTLGDYRIPGWSALHVAAWKPGFVEAKNDVEYVPLSYDAYLRSNATKEIVIRKFTRKEIKDRQES